MDSYKEYASKDFLEDQIDEKTSDYLSLKGGNLSPNGSIKFGQSNKLIFSIRTSQPSGSGQPIIAYNDCFNIEIGTPDVTEFDSKFWIPSPPHTYNLKISSLSDGQNIQFNAPLVMNRKQIHAVGDPVYDYDAATKLYVNNQLESYISFGTEDLEVGKEAPENITGRIYICYEEWGDK